MTPQLAPDPDVSSVFNLHNRPIVIGNWEEAQAVLYVHRSCMGRRCLARGSALQFVADVTGSGPSRRPNRTPEADR